jgi:PAS domain S-box-containing protein
MTELQQEMLRLQPGSHLCLFYENNPAEQTPALVPFIQDALSNDEQFIYIADDQTVEQLTGQLESHGINVGKETRKERLKLWTRNEWRQPGELLSDRKAMQVRQFIHSALASGFKGIRFGVEMTWTLGPDINAQQLEHWEATINTIFTPDFPGRIICQYNQTRLAPDVLIAGLYTHPTAILGDEVCPNPFYQAPLILNDEESDFDRRRHNGKMRARANWMIIQIKQARLAQRQREELIRKEAALAQAELDRQRIEASQERLRAIFNGSPGCINIVAPDGTLLEMNPSGVAMLEADSAEQVVGKKMFDFIAPEFRDAFRVMHERVCAGQREHLEFQIIGLRGTRRWMLSHASPICEPGADHFLHLAITHDITQRKTAEAALRQNDERFRLAAFSEDITLYEQDSELRYIWLYPLHPEHEHAMGRSDVEILQNEHGKQLAKWKREVMASGQSQRREVRTDNSPEARIYDVFILPKRNSAGKIVGIAGTALDITRRKSGEIAAQRLAAIVESSDDAIVSKDLNGIISSWNKGAERIFGYTAGEVIGKPVLILIPPDRHNEEPEILRRIRRGERIDHYETIRRRKDGTLIDISLTVSPVKDSNGKIIGASKIARDITGRKHAERELRDARNRLARANDELEKRVQERTASLRAAIAQMEEFSYTVSHDLRAPIRAMHGYAQVLREDYGAELDDQARDYLRRIIRSGARMDRLIQDVLTYSRLTRRDLQVAPVSLEKLVREILQQFPKVQSGAAQVIVENKLPVVLAHEASLLQAVSNLLDNALKFVAPETKPVVRVRSEPRDGQVRLWFQDNGIGIHPHQQNRLFGMFERIHPEKSYEGTGIGLALVRKAAERMGGTVGVESDGVNGSKFWIQLPEANS